VVFDWPILLLVVLVSFTLGFVAGEHLGIKVMMRSFIKAFGEHRTKALLNEVARHNGIDPPLD